MQITGSDANGNPMVRWTVQLVINPPLKGPVISTTPITGQANLPLLALVKISADPNDIHVTMINVSVQGVPSGMRLRGNTQGMLISWATPVKGTYVLGITATDITPNHGGKSTQASVTVTIE